MPFNMKFKIKNYLVKLLNFYLVKSKDPLDILLCKAIALHNNEIAMNILANELDHFYHNTDITMLLEQIKFNELYPQLINSGYKVDVLNYKSPCPWYLNTFKFWDKRLFLLRHCKIRLDLLILEKGACIPPHAHRGVVSGFLVLKGMVGIKHYHVSKYLDDGVICKKTIDKNLSVGDYTTNHDNRDNIHWLCGKDDEAILFRFNITGLSSPLPEYESLAGRMYVNPSNITSEDAFTSFVGLKDVHNLKFE
jgi:hypothetical protein